MHGGELLRPWAEKPENKNDELCQWILRVLESEFDDLDDKDKILELWDTKFCPGFAKQLKFDLESNNTVSSELDQYTIRIMAFRVMELRWTTIPML